MEAVLTCDIVNSTSLSKAQEKDLMSSLATVLEPFKHEFYRGDSFQVHIRDAGQALRTALTCRTAAMALDNDAATPVSDIRISIGLGNVEHPLRALATAKGEAFLLSGRAFDKLDKTEGRLVITNGQTDLGAMACTLIADYTQSICKSITPKQAEVIFELLKGESQQQVAEKLKKSKSTISQHVTAGGWNELEKLIEKYIQLIEFISA